MANGITVKTDKAFPARPHEVIRVFNQIRDEAFNSQPVTKEVIDVEKRDWMHGQAKDMSVVLNITAETGHQRALTADVSTSTGLSATQERIGKFTVQEGIAEDTETGLMWLRFAHGQTWQNGTTVGDAKYVDWNQAFKIDKQFNFNQLNGLSGHGHCDWRLPTIDELKTLIDRVKGKSGNTIDTDVFPNSAQWYWSSSLDASNNAWVMYFDNGNDDNCNKKNQNAVRLVRGNTIDKPAGNQIHSTAKNSLTSRARTPSTALLLARQQRFGKFAVEDGIAVDTETGLMWLRFAYGQTWQKGATVGSATNVNWYIAFEIANQLNQQRGYAGHCDWRLPTIDELKTLIDRVKGKSGNYIDTDVFPNNTACFWSSSLDASNNAWVMYFDNGNDDNCNKKNQNAVRLVRGNTINKPAGNQIHSAAKVR